MTKSEIQELEDLKLEYSFEEPNRGNLDDENIKWRHGKPVYVKANLAYLQGKSKNHAPNSLERVVEDLVKTWEMEASHKIDYKQWETVDHENYSIKGNAGKVSITDCCLGIYNMVLEQIFTSSCFGRIQLHQKQLIV